MDCSEEALLLIVLFGHLHYSERRVAQLAGRSSPSFRKDRKEGKLESGVNYCYHP